MGHADYPAANVFDDVMSVILRRNTRDKSPLGGSWAPVAPLFFQGECNGFRQDGGTARRPVRAAHQRRTLGRGSHVRRDSFRPLGRGRARDVKDFLLIGRAWVSLLAIQ